MKVRECKMCGEAKLLDDFANAGTVKGVSYKRHLCIPCYTQYKKPRQNQLREQYIELKKGLKCEKCGFDDHRALQFHHKNDDKEHNISDMINRGFAFDTIKKEIAKCETLCANCHQIEHQI